MSAAILAGLVRHVLTVVGGAYMAKWGIEIDPSAADAILGGAAALAGLAWSIYDKRAAR